MSTFIASVFRLVLLVLLLAGCSQDEPKLKKSLRRQADSIFNRKTSDISNEMDSLCHQQFDSLVQREFDSIIRERKENIERLSKPR